MAVVSACVGKQKQEVLEIKPRSQVVTTKVTDVRKQPNHPVVDLRKFGIGFAAKDCLVQRIVLLPDCSVYARHICDVGRDCTH